MMSDREKHPASGAIDGTRDMSRYVDGGVWLSSLRVTEETPAILTIQLREPARVNRVVIYHVPDSNNQLVDFALESRSPQAGTFAPVQPVGDWTNPVKGNLDRISTLDFAGVTTDALRLVITAGSPDCLGARGYGQAYVTEFEACFIDREAERAAMAKKRRAFASVAPLAAAWRKARVAREEQRLAGQRTSNRDVDESPVFAWVRNEKIRTVHTGLGADHLRELVPELAAVGFNAFDASGRRFASQPERWEPAFQAAHELGEQHDMSFTPWFAWYFYPNDDYAPDRNCVEDLLRDGDYRRAVDFTGKTLPVAPCPLWETFWADMRRNVVQVATWAKTYPRTWGLCLDFEFYGTGSTRQSSDWYGYEICFCDHCFNRFLKAVGSDLTAADVDPADRWARLQEAGAVEAHYEVLADEVRRRAVMVREAGHAVHPDLVLQVYGVPAFIEDKPSETLEHGPLFKSWFGNALLRGFGTRQMPCLIKPLDASVLLPRETAWTFTTQVVLNHIGHGMAREAGKPYQQLLDEANLHALYVGGVVICNESNSEVMGDAIRVLLEKGNGFWFNEAWMLIAFRNPDHPRPGWWTTNETEDIEAFWSMLKRELAH